MKRFISVAAGVAVALTMTAGAANAATTATSTVTIDGQGSLYKQVKKPVNLTFTAKITPGAGATSLKPLMESKYHLPTDLAFVPSASMPPCTAVNEQNTSFPDTTARDLCKDSIIGDGTAKILLAGALAAPINDPVLTIFANGKASDGSGKLAIHAYSASTNQGIYMTGAISKDGILDVAIPRLTADSATTDFTLNIPGQIGKDPTYAQASCSTGKYTSNADFTLGNRDAAGTVSNSETITTDPVTTDCNGLAGKAQFASLKIKAPKKVKNGKKGVFKVTVKNKGTATSKKGTVKASGAGKGKASLPAIKPGASKTIKVKAKVKGKKGKKVTVKFKASGGASASGKAKVKVG